MIEYNFTSLVLILVLTPVLFRMITRVRSIDRRVKHIELTSMIISPVNKPGGPFEHRIKRKPVINLESEIVKKEREAEGLDSQI